MANRRLFSLSTFKPRVERLEEKTLPSLVAAFGFEEGSGAVARDATVNHLDGTLSNATWTTAGRFGNALNFNGSNALVSVAHNALLNVTNGLTLEAWVRPTSLSGWGTVLFKEKGSSDLAFDLYASAGAGNPPVGHINSGGYVETLASSALPLNTWSHLALTYDGTSQKLYVNGGLAASRSFTGNVDASTSPLRIGGNSIWGEYFAGSIDEVRVYNHALSQSQVQTDMNTAVGGTGTGDTTPPTVTAATPGNAAFSVAVGSNVTVTFSEPMDPASISANTIELRTPGNSVVPATVTYNATTRTATLDPTANLSAVNDFYNLRVKSGSTGLKDAAGNALATDFTWSFSTGTPVFQEQTVLSGLTNPTKICFAPDGRVFVAEKSGIIKVYPTINSTTPTVFADLRTQVHNYWDRGLLGMALDPQFPTRPYVYVLYTYDAPIGGTAPSWGTVGGTSDNGPGTTGNAPYVSGRLSRLQISASNTQVGGETVLINDWVQQYPSHSIGDLRFGSDGMLYASGGDGASFNNVDYGQVGNTGDPLNEGGALRSQDLRTTGDPTGLDGTVIRIDPNTGAGAAGNPLASSSDANARRIVGYGLRNPFRFTIRPGTNEVWLGDVGWNDWEEINRIVAPADGTVDNFGWPGYEGNGVQAGYQAANRPLLQNLYAAGPSAVVNPYYTYQHSAQVIPGSTEPTGGSSISGLAFGAAGANMPAAYEGALFFSDYSRNRIWVMPKGIDGLPDPSNRKTVLGPATGPVGLEMGPDGSLYYVDLNTGTIRRFQYLRANQAPNAVLTANPTFGTAPLTVSFSAASSNDPDGNPITYSWDLNGDGTFGDSTSVTPTFTYTTGGQYTVSLRVTDNQGASDTKTQLITVGRAPTAIIDTPSSTLTWRVGQTISFSGRGTDPDEGTLAASRLTWSLILHHGTHTHAIQDYVGVASGSFTAPDHEYPAFLELRLTVTDSTGLTNTSSINLQPQTITITLQSVPTGLQLGLNGVAGVGPVSRTAIVGSTNSLSAPTPQSFNGVNYQFVSWSDGGAGNHSIIAPTANVTYTANYQVQTGTPGLVAAYGFNEGAGTVLGDASGNNLNGAITGATWNSTGKFGKALSFDGNSNWVTVADNNLLDLTTAMTLEAWVRPSVANSWDTVLMKEDRTYDLAYSLYSAAGAGNPPVGYLQAGGYGEALGNSVVPVNQWSHLALTYDNASLRLYVNGILVASKAKSGTITTTASPLRIGGNNVWGEFFNGLIDEVRIYNRVLAAAEIQTDMNTPVGTPLQLAGPLGGNGPGVYNVKAIQPLIDVAVKQWASVGLTWAQKQKLKLLRVEIRNLPGNALALSSGTMIYLDTNAAGKGWFIDRTPSTLWDYIPKNRVDLLTVITHEVGHVLGFDDNRKPGAKNVMAATLPMGVRRLPTVADKLAKPAARTMLYVDANVLEILTHGKKKR